MRPGETGKSLRGGFQHACRFQPADGDKKRGEEKEHIPIHCLEKVAGIRKEPGHRQRDAKKGDDGELEMQRILECEQREHDAQHNQQLG